MPFVNEALEFRDRGLTLQTSIKKIIRGTVSLDPADLATITSAENAVTISGLAVGDEIFFSVPASLNLGLAFSGSRISAADTAQIRLTNVTAGSINDTARTWSYIWFDLT